MLRSALMAGLFAAIARVFGRSGARNARGMVRGVRTINRFRRWR
jgi:hypothetical protein